MSETEKQTTPLDLWASVELMGHVHVWGRVSEEEHFGQKLGRVDVPNGDGADDYVSQFFGGSAVYRLTPCDEETAREMAGYRPRRLGVFRYPPRGSTFDDDTSDDVGGDEPSGGFDRGTVDSEAIPRQDDRAGDNLPP